MPGGEWPHIFSAIQALGLEFSQSEYSSGSQHQQLPQAIGNGHDHPVADLEVLHARGPTSTTSPMNSWPRMSPDSIVGMKPL